MVFSRPMDLKLWGLIPKKELSPGYICPIQLRWKMEYSVKISIINDHDAETNFSSLHFNNHRQKPDKLARTSNIKKVDNIKNKIIQSMTDKVAP